MSSNDPTFIKHLVDSGPKETTFFSDDQGGESKIPVYEDSSRVASDLHIEGTQDISTYLSRPVKLAAGTFSSSDSGAMFSLSPLAAILNAWSTKLNNIQLIRGEIEVTVHLNAQRFDTGRYMLCFVPGFGSSLAPTTTPFNMWNSTLTQRTQLLHVEFDLSSDTSAVLKIPWMSIQPYFPNQTTVANAMVLGNLEMRPYYPLQQVNSIGSPGYTVYVRMVNVQLAGPTVVQMGTKEEQLKAGIGPVSGFLSSVSKTAASLAVVPSISVHATGVAWLTNLLSKAAAAMGWIKPVALQAPVYVQPRHVAFLENVDGCSTARVLGAFQTNAVEAVPDGVGPLQDEMSLNFFSSKFAWVQTALWDTTMVAGAEIVRLAATPWWKISNGLSYTVPPVSFPLTMFRKWRGGIKFRVKLVKNEFYSGRLGVIFCPIEPGGNMYPQLGNLGVEYNRAIIDIRGRREFEFILPYSSVRNYLLRNEQFGIASIYVIDPLVAPDSCPNNVALLIEVCGADDFEYIDPSLPRTNVILPFAPQAGVTETEILDCYCLGKTVVPSLAVDKAAIGERVTSLRQLIKRVGSKFNDKRTWVTGNAVTFSPFWTSVYRQYTSISTAPTVSTYQTDFFSLITACYGITTGSVRVQFWSSGYAPDTTVRVCTNDDYAHTNMLDNTGDTASQNLSFITPISKEGCVDVQVPAYNLYLGRPTIANLFTAVGSIVPSAVGATPRYIQLTPLDSTQAVGTTVQVTRQAADDFNCLWFVATPSLYDD